MVQISQAELDKLLDSSKILGALEASGVDNWEGYDIALEDYRKGKELIDKADDAFEQVVECLSNGIFEPSERGAGFSFNEDDTKEARDIIRKLVS